VRHIDDETLALLALGEDVLDDAARDHLDVCETCAEAARELTSVASVARTADDVVLVDPPPRVWDRVRAELDLTDVDVDAPEGRARSATATTPGPDPEDAPPAGVVAFAPRRRRTWLPVAAAACLALLVGVAGGVWWERREVEPPETTVATAELQALPGWDGASGVARVEETPEGRRQVVVTVDAPAPDGTFREVWLLAEDVSGLVSLGVLDGTEGRFDLPDGLDLGEFPLVDVSEEHFDGDPAHSGDSVVRGPLDV